MRHLLLLVPALLLAGTPRYARVGDFEGAVETQADAASAWLAAERNTPLPQSARVRTAAASRIEIELDEGSVVRLGPETECELSDYVRLATGQRVTLLSVDHGVAYVTGAPEGRDSLTVALPGAQVTFTRRARLRVQIEPQWSQIAVLQGAARFSSPAADMELREGQSTRVEPDNPDRFYFYKEIPPLDSDQWAGDRDSALAAPASAAHVVERYGVADLDGAGEWSISQEFGVFWRPKVDENWRPFRDGRWRWQEGLGYTWIAAERWGWLPYHYGRWMRHDQLGWVWVPSKNGVFKPGEVYWLRGKSYVAWGPLAPGEQWDPTDPVNPMPAQFVDANTTYAKYAPYPTAIDAAATVKPPKDPLNDADFTAALPSPPFYASRLDAVRPLVNATTLRVKPVVDGVTIETASARPRPSAPPITSPAPQPIVIITPPSPPSPPEVVEVPVPYAWPVFISTPPQPSRTSHAAKAAPRAVTPVARQDRVPFTPPAKRYRGKDEGALVGAVVRELEGQSFRKAIEGLATWTDRYRETDFADERAYYYMLAYNGLDQPANVIASGTPLVAKPANAAFEDPMQALSVLYLTATNFRKLSRPAREQALVARGAAAQLLALAPVCFTAERRPGSMTAAQWASSRADLEAMARDILAKTGR